MTNKTKQTIVLARLEEDFRVIEYRRTDLGERPLMERIDKPVACIWLNAGSDDDVSKAQKYAATAGYTVYTYATSERDPLGRAKKDIVTNRRA